jgi:SAM-dependent methyltransferase
VSEKPEGWDVAYAGPPPAWVIGHAQPVIVELSDQGLLTGRVLDVGCSTGEHAMLAAGRGADALGVDVSPLAIRQATDIVRSRRNSARFAVGDALNLAATGEIFDVVIDSGLFHTFEHEADRRRYAESLAGVLRPAGTLFITCISAEQDGSWGPHRVTEGELRQSFGADGVSTICARVREVKGRAGDGRHLQRRQSRCCPPGLRADPR